jgi:hypothetical protein
MQIDRSNYEIWLIDWMDGELTSSQEGQLMTFLDQNPDLRGELNDLTPVNTEFVGVAFRNKEQLKKQPSEISSSQFEYLCAAYLENDLNESQKAEVEEIVYTSPDRKKTFDLMQKAFVHGVKIRYPHKKQILRKTKLQKIIYLSATGIGAAAVVSLFIIVYSAIRGTNHLKTGIPAGQTLTEGRQPPDYQTPGKEMPETVKIAAYPEKITEKRSAATIEKSTAGDAVTETFPAESTTPEIEKNEIIINKVPVNRTIYLTHANPDNSLVESSRDFIPAEEPEESGRSVSKLFREKLLKEKNPAESPLKGYEIAEAGVAGLNKILGWKMALSRSTDETGQPISVYFRSKILKVQAPVKEREDTP